MTNCCVPHCRNSSKNGHSLLRFPRDEQIRKKWALKVRGSSGWTPTYHRICDVHFQESDWVKFKSTLKPGVIPSLFCQCHNCCAIFGRSRCFEKENYGHKDESLGSSLASKCGGDWEYTKQILEREHLKKQIQAAEVELRVLCEALAWQERIFEHELGLTDYSYL